MKYLKGFAFWFLSSFSTLNEYELANVSVCRLIRNIIFAICLFIFLTVFVVWGIYAIIMVFIVTPLALLYESYIGAIPFSKTIHTFIMPMFVFYSFGLIVYFCNGIKRLIYWYAANKPNKDFDNKSVKSTWFASIRDKVCYYVDISDWQLK